MSRCLTCRGGEGCCGGHPADEPRPSAPAGGCPYGECDEGFVCTGCRIDAEIERATSVPPLRWGS